MQKTQFSLLVSALAEVWLFCPIFVPLSLRDRQASVNNILEVKMTQHMKLLVKKLRKKWGGRENKFLASTLIEYIALMSLHPS